MDLRLAVAGAALGRTVIDDPKRSPMHRKFLLKDGRNLRNEEIEFP
jgi:hypothetical protein